MPRVEKRRNARRGEKMPVAVLAVLLNVAITLIAAGGILLIISLLAFMWMGGIQ